MRVITFRRVPLIRTLATVACAVAVFQGGVVAQNQTRRLAPEFQVKLLDDRVLSASDIQDHITVIDFWATWCKPCVAEIPEYNAFHREYRDKGVIFLALALDSGKVETVKAAAKRFNIEYPAAAPSGKEMKAIGKVRAFPTTWVIGRDGEIIREFVGVVTGKQDAIREIVDGLIAEQFK